MNQHQWRLSNRLASDCNGKGKIYFNAHWIPSVAHSTFL